MSKKISRYLLPSAMCIALSGCYINAYPPDQPVQPVYQQHATGGVIPPNYVPPSIRVNPPAHSTGGVIPPNYIPPTVKVKPQPTPKVLKKKKNPATA